MTSSPVATQRRAPALARNLPRAGVSSLIRWQIAQDDFSGANGRATTFSLIAFQWRLITTHGCDGSKPATARSATTRSVRLGVSTVFLGIDHNFYGSSGPVLFQPLIFDGPLADEMWRYSTYAEAERGHQEAVTQVRIAAAKIKSVANKGDI